MKFTYNWLREYVAVELDPDAVAARLTMLGLEVDAVLPLYPSLDEVRVARVAALCQHPNADRLTLCDVEDGSGALRRVVCGAPNVRVGMFTPLAVPGTVLPGDFKISANKIRGELSAGMLCSEQELGLADSETASGEIMDLDPVEFPGLAPGMPLRQALNLQDTMIEVDLTPNRPDCAGVIGLAREVAGFSGLPLSKPVKIAPLLLQTAVTDRPFAVTVATPQCHRYTARLLRRVRVAPSPRWLRWRLAAVGLRPINNVVDVTNLVMMEYGQPMHAFDFDRLKGGRIQVRQAGVGEKMITLDGVERQLTPEMMVIADDKQVVALAGIIGAENSEISSQTTNILLESACFAANSVRRSAAALQLATDSSYRFERGVDPQVAPLALERAVQLILKLAGGEEVVGGVDYRGGAPDLPILTLRLSRVNNILGTDLDLATVERLLAGIEINAKRLDDQTLRIVPPSFRVDLLREIDLIEEVARLVGYDFIPTNMPSLTMTLPTLATGGALREKVRALMIAAGCHEVINYSFVNPIHRRSLGLGADDAESHPLALLNPLSEEQSVLRTSLLPGLLENVRHNINHQCLDLRLFELGKVFFPAGVDLPREEERLAAIFSGRRYPGAPLLWEGETLVDVYDVKGVVEQLLAGLGLGSGLSVWSMTATRKVKPYAEIGYSLALTNNEGKILGTWGKFRQSVLKAFGIKQEVFYLDLGLDLVGQIDHQVNQVELTACSPESSAFAPLPKFPAVKRDLAMLVPDDVEVGEMLMVIREAGGKLLDQVEIFDVYRGKHVASGRKSVAFAIHYRDATQTLNEKKAEAAHCKIIALLSQRFHGQLREAR